MSVHKDKERGTWYFTIRSEGHQTKRRGFRTRREAIDAESNFLNDYNNSNNHSKLTFLQCYDHYMNDAKTRLKTRTIYSNSKLFEKHILPFFGRKSMVAITPRDINTWKLSMDNYSYQYKAKALSVLKSILGFCELHYGINNAAKKIPNYSNKNIENHSTDYFTFEEFDKFINYVKSVDYEYFVFFSFLYYTGLRRGEAQALTWDDINMQSHEIVVKKTYSAQNGTGTHMITSPKTKASYRSVLMGEYLFTMMQEFKNYNVKYKGFSDQSFVFGVSVPYSNTTIERKKNIYCQMAGVKQIRIHDFRHSHASLLINNGADAFIVAKRLGHSVKMVQETYSHLFPNEQKKLMNIIDRISMKM